MKNAFDASLRRRYASSVLTGLTSLLLSFSARAESGQPSPVKVKVVVTTSLITPLFGAYYLESNIRIANSWGLVLNASRLTHPTLANDEWTTTANTVGAGLSYYFQGEALRHWYVEAIGELWLNSRKHDPSGRAAATALGGAGLMDVGYRFLHPLGPVLDLGVGAVLFRLPGASVGTGTDEVAAAAQTHIYPTVKVNVGWAF